MVPGRRSAAGEGDVASDDDSFGPSRTRPAQRRPLKPGELKSRRQRNVAIGVAIGLLVVLFYAVTIVKMGPGVLNRPL